MSACVDASAIRCASVAAMAIVTIISKRDMNVSLGGGCVVGLAERGSETFSLWGIRTCRTIRCARLALTT